MLLCRRQFRLVGDTLLTADNPSEDKDSALFRKLGIQPMELSAP